MGPGGGEDGARNSGSATSPGDGGADRTRPLSESASGTEHPPAINAMHKAAMITHELTKFGFFIAVVSLIGR